MIQNGEVFDTADYAELQSPRPPKVVLTDETAIAFLAAQGYDVSSLEKTAV